MITNFPKFTIGWAEKRFNEIAAGPKRAYHTGEKIRAGDVAFHICDDVRKKCEADNKNVVVLGPTFGRKLIVRVLGGTDKDDWVVTLLSTYRVIVPRRTKCIHKFKY